MDRHARKRLRQWLCAKHHKQGAAIKQFPEASLHDKLGLVRLTLRTRSLPWATSCTFSESRMREKRLSGSMSGLCQEDEKSSCCTKDEGGPFGVAL